MTSKNVCHLLNVYLEKCGCFGHHSLFCVFYSIYSLFCLPGSHMPPYRSQRTSVGASSFLPPRGLQGSISACHVWQQAPLLAEPSCWPISFKQLNLTNHHIIHSLNKYVWRNPSVLAYLAPRN